MSGLKWRVNSCSNFALFFIVMTQNSSVSFKIVPFLLWTKGSHQSPNFYTFKCSGENFPNWSCLFPNRKSVFLLNLNKSSVSWKITPLYFCSSSNICTYNLVTRSQLKHTFFWLSSALAKICGVPHVSFKTTSQFLFNFCIILHYHDT